MARIITDYLEEICKSYPQKIAVSEGGKKITFEQLRSRSCKIASIFIGDGVFHRPIAVYLDKGIDAIVSFLGCAYSGNYYSPIDPNMPLARAKRIFDTLAPVSVITSEKYVEGLKSINSEMDIKLISEIEYLDEVVSIVAKTTKRITDKDVLYVLFTSGSTGTPKGVIISHHATISYTEWASEAFSICSEDILGNQTPFYFSMSVFDIYQMLSQGCTMEIIPKELFSRPAEILDYMEEHSVNTIYWVPSALSIIAKSGVIGTKSIHFLERILFAGEVMPNSVLNVWREANPNALFANLFGPTELTDICTYYIVNRKFSDNESLPIGQACLNTGIIVLDENDKLITENECGVVGELCVRGSTIAYGYYRNKEKTKEVFVQNPLNDVYDEIIYRTGDLVKYNEYNELMYVGRKDFQVKVSGYRIELGEIETAVSSIQSVRLNCCMFDGINQILVLFVEGNTSKQIIRTELKKLLPRYMMPHKYIILDKIPINSNGKIDRVRLKSEFLDTI